MKVIRTTKIKIKGSKKAPEIIQNYLKALNWLSPLAFNRQRYILREQGFRRMGSVNTHEKSGHEYEMVLHSTTCSGS